MMVVPWLTAAVLVRRHVGDRKGVLEMSMGIAAQIWHGR